MSAKGPRSARALRGPARVCALAMLALVLAAAAPGVAHARSAAAQGPGPSTCVVRSLPSFVAQGEFGTTATVADVIEVGCDPTIYGTDSKIKITASQLYSRCKGRLVWIVPN